MVILTQAERAERREAIREYVEEGHTALEAANAFGVTRTMVYHCVAKNPRRKLNLKKPTVKTRLSYAVRSLDLTFEAMKDWVTPFDGAPPEKPPSDQDLLAFYGALDKARALVLQAYGAAVWMGAE